MGLKDPFEEGANWKTLSESVSVSFLVSFDFGLSIEDLLEKIGLV